MKNVLLVPDVDNWCFGLQSKAIQKYAPSDYNVGVVVQNEFQQHRDSPQFLRTWDAIFHYSWVSSPCWFGINRLVGLVAHEGLMYHFISDENGIPFMASWPQWAASSPQRNLGNAGKILPKLDHVICVNPQIQRFVSSTLNERSEYLPVGVDHNVYVPKKPINTRKLRVGWCGQEGGRTKGYNWIMEPLMKRMGDKVEWKINRRSHKDALTQEEMVDWYNDIDVFLCTSINEGTPAPPLEAMSCGRPVITTDVGDMASVLTEECGDLVSSYDEEETGKKVIQEIEHLLSYLKSEEARTMGEAARKRIEDHFTWEQMSPKWLKSIAG